MTTPYRAIVDRLPAYTLAEQADDERTIQLGQNELGRSPSPLAVHAAKQAVNTLDRYPDIGHRRLRAAIADCFHLNAEQVLCGAGSMELMGLIATVFLEPGSEVIVSEYGYKYFQLQCAIAGAEIKIAAERGLTVDIEAVLAQVTPATRMVYLANPGNPTGYLIPSSEIAGLRECLPESVMLLLDCAYAEFAAGDELDTGFDRVDAGENVVVLRTFSKAYGLAGLRVGWMYASKTVSDRVARVRPPNSITTVGLAAAAAAVADQAFLSETVDEVIELRRSLAADLTQRGFAVHPSNGNFLLVQCNPSSPIQAAELVAGLLSHHIIVRPMQSYGLSDCLRITIGSRSDMETLSRALAATIGNSGPRN